MLLPRSNRRHIRTPQHQPQTPSLKTSAQTSATSPSTSTKSHPLTSTTPSPGLSHPPKPQIWLLCTQSPAVRLGRISYVALEDAEKARREAAHNPMELANSIRNIPRKRMKLTRTSTARNRHPRRNVHRHRALHGRQEGRGPDVASHQREEQGRGELCQVRRPHTAPSAIGCARIRRLIGSTGNTSRRPRTRCLGNKHAMMRLDLGLGV